MTDIFVKKSGSGTLKRDTQLRVSPAPEVELLALDEADRMLDLGFIDDILNVVEYLPSQRQNLLFSATYSQSIKQLAAELLYQPVARSMIKLNNLTVVSLFTVVCDVLYYEKSISAFVALPGMRRALL